MPFFLTAQENCVRDEYKLAFENCKVKLSFISIKNINCILYGFILYKSKGEEYFLKLMYYIRQSQCMM